MKTILTIALVGSLTIPTNLLEEHFIERFDAAFAAEVAQFPRDKQKHILMSRGVFGTVAADLLDPTAAGLEKFIVTLAVGYNKELKDKGIPSEDILDHLSVMLLQVQQIDAKTRIYGLDTGDLLADMFGASAALMLYSDMELYINAGGP